jgi:hypothetical protein
MSARDVDDIDEGEVDRLLRPGTYWDGVEVVDNPAFQQLRQTRAPQPSREERLLSSAIYAAEQLHRQSIPVTPETLHDENGDISFAIWRDLYASEKFLSALEQRGIALPSQSGLTPQQLSALAIYMDMSAKMTHPQKLKAAGVTEAQWQGWRRQPLFEAYLAETAEGLLTQSVPVALQRIAEATDAGERWAIELGLEMTRRHDRRDRAIDVSALLLQVFSVLDDEGVPDVVLGRIAGRIREMMGQAAPQQIIVQAAPQSMPGTAAMLPANELQERAG